MEVSLSSKILPCPIDRHKNCHKKIQQIILIEEKKYFFLSKICVKNLLIHSGQRLFYFFGEKTHVIVDLEKCIVCFMNNKIGQFGNNYTVAVM